MSGQEEAATTERVEKCPDCNRRGDIDGIECCRCAGTGHIGRIGEPWLTLHAEHCVACGSGSSEAPR